MNNEKIKDYININGGITLDKEKNSFSSDKGYMVSLYGKEKTFKTLDGLIIELDNYINYIQDKVSSFVGVWVDNDIYYLDISIYISSLTLAKKVGKDNLQLAIFDLYNKNSIYLDYNITNYTLYDNNDRLIFSSDKLSEIQNFLGVALKTIKNAMNKNIKVSNNYYIVSNKINVRELAG